MTEEEFKWGWMVVATRAFTVEGHYALVPVADDMNTESPAIARANVDWFPNWAWHMDWDVSDRTGRVFELKASRDIGANQELLTTYALPGWTNEVFAQNWGFLLHPNPNKLKVLPAVSCAKLREVERDKGKPFL